MGAGAVLPPTSVAVGCPRRFMCARGPKGDTGGSAAGARAVLGRGVPPCTPSTGIGATGGGAGTVVPIGQAEGAAAPKGGAAGADGAWE